MTVGEYFFCPRCGQALQNGTAYCPACGLPLTFSAGDLSPCPPSRKNSSNCLAVTSLVLGICSILSCLLLLIDSVGGFFCFNSISLGAAGRTIFVSYTHLDVYKRQLVEGFFVESFA